MEGFALKNNLIYQTSEYDCGTACLVNALRYLYERDEIIPEVLKAMYTFLVQVKLACIILPIG